MDGKKKNTVSETESVTLLKMSDNDEINVDVQDYNNIKMKAYFDEY